MNRKSNRILYYTIKHTYFIKVRNWDENFLCVVWNVWVGTTIYPYTQTHKQTQTMKIEMAE